MFVLAFWWVQFGWFRMGLQVQEISVLGRFGCENHLSETGTEIVPRELSEVAIVKEK
uniref:Uncharacterized protein n=1 Tax=Candidozyma auris TaxID=498019 RepID=A0A0L0NT06_CANAR